MVRCVAIYNLESPLNISQIRTLQIRDLRKSDYRQVRRHLQSGKSIKYFTDPHPTDKRLQIKDLRKSDYRQVRRHL